MKMVTINGVAYPNREITFNDFCAFEDKGLDLQKMGEKPMNFIRAYVALLMNGSDEEAGLAINDHIANGGDIEDIMNAMSEAIEESGFFRPQQQTAKSSTPKSESKEQPKE